MPNIILTASAVTREALRAAVQATAGAGGLRDELRAKAWTRRRHEQAQRGR